MAYRRHGVGVAIGCGVVLGDENGSGWVCGMVLVIGWSCTRQAVARQTCGV